MQRPCSVSFRQHDNSGLRRAFKEFCAVAEAMLWLLLQPTHVYTSLHINAGLCPQQTAQPEDCFLCPCRGHALAAAASQHMCTPLLTSNAGLCLQQDWHSLKIAPCAHAEAVRWLLLPANTPLYTAGLNMMTNLTSVQADMGAAMGYAWHTLADDGRCLLFAWLLWVAVALFCWN